MSEQAKRTYNAPRREAAAEQTRLAIVDAAKRRFERDGWSRATMRTISDDAGVSQKTAEVIFGTKGALLQAAVDYAIRGDLDPTPLSAREAIAEMSATPTATEMLRLHARHLRNVHGRSARIAAVVEQAGSSDPKAATLWKRMSVNRRSGVDWAVETLLAKPGTGHLDAEDAWLTFWVTVDWGTYRTLTDAPGLDPDGYESWVVRYYERMFQLEKVGAGPPLTT
jgi:TetR/AcrR family transcriptional regulator, regulator of autoinduction and epiphytic fitness